MEFYYRCSECGKTYDMSPGHMVCPSCSGKQENDRPLRGILEVDFNGSWNGNRRGSGDTSTSLFDQGDLICVEKVHFPTIPVGQTPLWAPARLREAAGFPGLFLKDDTANPTGSLKDRASYLVAAYARKHKIKNVVVASTGNAASSMAGVGAAAELDVTIFMPAGAPKAKQIQALQYGAKVELVDGTYDEAFELALEYKDRPGFISRNTAFNPLTIEGKKTAALEIFFQLGRVPDQVYVPTGDGVIISGVCKGFEDLLKAGMSSRMPRIIAAQAEGSSAIARALEKGDFGDPVSSTTLADSISVDVPRGGYYAVKKLKQHGGGAVIVSDDDILEAQYELASLSGLFAEPAAAAAYAGFLRERERISSDETVVILITGSGLKDIDAAARRFE
jgi:threonine synthase